MGANGQSVTSGSNPSPPPPVQAVPPPPARVLELVPFTPASSLVGDVDTAPVPAPATLPVLTIAPTPAAETPTQTPAETPAETPLPVRARFACYCILQAFWHHNPESVYGPFLQVNCTQRCVPLFCAPVVDNSLFNTLKMR